MAKKNISGRPRSNVGRSKKDYEPHKQHLLLVEFVQNKRQAGLSLEKAPKKGLKWVQGMLWPEPAHQIP